MSNGRVEEPRIGWTATTWEGSRREQLRRARQLTVRERLAAAENMAKVARRLRDAGRKAKSRERFETRLKAEGYSEMRTNALPPNHRNPQHTHPFDVLAMVLEGEITLTVAGKAKTYRPGDEFSMKAGCPAAARSPWCAPTGARR